MNKDSLIYLDTYLLQQDMRIRMPKSILENLNIEKGQTRFDIFLNQKEGTLILKISYPSDNNQRGKYDVKKEQN